MVVNQDDINAFAEMSVAELLNQITVLHTEIEYAKSQLQPHDTGHIHTAINWMTERIKNQTKSTRYL